MSFLSLSFLSSLPSSNISFSPPLPGSPFFSSSHSFYPTSPTSCIKAKDVDGR